LGDERNAFIGEELQHNRRCVTRCVIAVLTLILLTWKIERVPNNASKWQMGFNLAFKGLKKTTEITFQEKHHLEHRNWNMSLKYMDEERAGIAQSV